MTVEIVDGWKSPTVRDLQDSNCLLVEDGNHGEFRPRTDEFCSDGTAFIRAADMDGGRVQFAHASRINKTAMSRIRKGIGASGDVLLSHKGTVGKVAFVPLSAPPFVCSPQTTFWRSLDQSRIDRRYLFYFLQSPHFRDQLNSRKGETDMADYVSLTAQRELKVVLPPIREQSAIGTILGALDDKIDLNRRTTETLEAMARAIFQSWFVDFDPVRTKLDGRQPADMDAETAALFPDHFDHSELGPVPKGWKVCRWGDIATLEYGKSLRDYTDAHGPFRVYGTNGPIGWHTESLCESPGIVIGRKGAYRGVHYSPAPFFVIDTAFFLRPKVEIEMKWAYYELLNFDINGMDSGSAIPSTSRDDFYAIPVCVPSRSVLSEFGRRLAPLYDMRAAKQVENDCLATVRDALLPKLLSGELRIDEAETIAGAVA